MNLNVKFIYFENLSTITSVRGMADDGAFYTKYGNSPLVWDDEIWRFKKKLGK